MRDQEIVGLWEAYASIYTQTEQTVEEEVVDEDLQQKVGQALDAAAKNPVVQAIGKVIAPVGQGRKTPTKDGNWRPVVAKEETEEVEHLDEITRSMGRRADEYNKKKAQDAHMERVRKHQENMKNDPEYRANHERLRQVHSRREDQKESFDLFDYLLEYLVAEGYADTNKAALAIMANMSEEWKQSIVEGEEKKEEPQKPFTGEGPKKPKGWKPTGPKLKTGQRPGYAR